MYSIHSSFREVFKDYSDCFTIIGGTASAIILSKDGLEWRATKDYDLVIKESARPEEFYLVLHGFLNNGNYIMEKQNYNKNLYRFVSNAEGYPEMIELLCQRPSFASECSGAITSLSFTDENSLSAIMMDEEYYAFVCDNTVIIEGMPTLNETGLIVLKAKAWYYLLLEKEAGINITNSEVSKHIKDISRLVQLFEDDDKIDMCQVIKKDMNLFLDLLKENIHKIPESRDYYYTRSEVYDLLENILKNNHGL